MLKKLLFISFLFITPGVMAQEAFWSFDDNGEEMIIPPECDTTFDAEELYEIGVRLLEETGSAQMGAGYCLLSSAFAGHVGAQLEVAKMYHKGISMPKSDLAAYKWATLAALNGNEEADQLGATIEQFLSIQDIEISTEYISIDKLLKFAGIADTGGQAFMMIEDGVVLLNGEKVQEKRRKVYAGDVVTVAGQLQITVVREAE